MRRNMNRQVAAAIALLPLAFTAIPAAVGGAEPISVERTISDDLTTPTQVFYDNGDGTTTAEFTAGPVRFLSEDATWERIDLNLQREDDKLVPAAPLAPVTFSSTGNRITVTTRVGTFEVDHEEITAPASVSVEGPSVRYVDALSGNRDIVQRAIVSGFKESIIVDGPNADESYQQKVKLPHGILASQAGGDIVFINERGSEVARYGCGFAIDAAGIEAPVTTQLTQLVNGSASVSVNVSTSWMQSPTRAFPVEIDPVFQARTGVGNSLDT